MSMKMELPKFDVVLYRIQQFLQPVFETAIHEKEFFMDWDSNKKQWQEKNSKEKPE